MTWFAGSASMRVTGARRGRCAGPRARGRAPRPRPACRRASRARRAGASAATRSRVRAGVARARLPDRSPRTAARRPARAHAARRPARAAARATRRCARRARRPRRAPRRRAPRDRPAASCRRSRRTGAVPAATAKPCPHPTRAGRGVEARRRGFVRECRASFRGGSMSARNDPLAGAGPLGRVEVVADGVAQFHGFCNVGFVFGGGASLVVDTSNPILGPWKLPSSSARRPPTRSRRWSTPTATSTTSAARPPSSPAASRAVQHAPAIWGHENVPERLNRYLRTWGWNNEVNRRQFQLPPGIDAFPKSFVQPDHTYATARDRPRRRARRAAARTRRDRRRYLGVAAAARGGAGRRPLRAVAAQHRQPQQAAALHARLGGDARGDRRAEAEGRRARTRRPTARRDAIEMLPRPRARCASCTTPSSSA